MVIFFPPKYTSRGLLELNPSCSAVMKSAIENIIHVQYIVRIL